MRDTMLKLAKTWILVGAVALVGACAEPAVAPPAAPKSYTVTSVDVTVAAGAGVGRLADPQQQNDIVKSLDLRLDQVAPTVGGGATPARAKVVITKLQLRDAGARAFGAMNGIEAQVTIVNAKGEVLRPTERVVYADQARNNQSTFNGIPVGVLVNLGRNSSDQEAGNDTAKMIEGFSVAFANWLKR